MPQIKKDTQDIIRKTQDSLTKTVVNKASFFFKAIGKEKNFKGLLDQNTVEIKKQGVTLKRIEKTFIEIDKNIRSFKFFTMGLLDLSEPEEEMKRAGARKKFGYIPVTEKKPPEKKRGRFGLFFRVRPRKVRPTKLKRKPRPPRRRIRASARKRNFNRRLRNVLNRIRANSKRRLARLRGIERYRSNVQTQRRLRRLERVRLREETRIARERINTDRTRIIASAEADAQRTRIAAANEASRIASEAEARARARLSSAEAETRRITAEAEAVARTTVTESDTRARATIAEADARARATIAEADAESRRRIDAATQQVTEANQRTQQLNEESRRLEARRQAYINDAAVAAQTIDDAKAELKRVQADTNIAAAERDRIVARQQDLIREYESLKTTFRDASVQADLERQAIDARAAEEQRRITSLQNTIDESNRLAEQRRIQNAVASGTVPQQPTVEPTRPLPQTTPKPTRPTPQPAPVVERPPSQPILNEQQRANAKLIAQSKIIAATAEAVRKKAPLIGLVLAGGIIGWQLIQGKITQAAISAAETFDPTWFGITALTILPVIKLETYYETFGLDPNIDPENPGGILNGPKYKEISDIVDKEWEETKKKLQESLEKRKKEWRNKWKRDLDRGVGETLRGSVRSDTPDQRGRGRNVMPAERPAIRIPESQPPTPVRKPPPGSLLLPNETVADAIRKASNLVGVSEAIMLAMAKQESTFNPNATADSTKAKGLFQFLDSTWNDMVKKYGKKYPQLYAGPYDALASAIAGALYIKENSKILEAAKLEVTGANIYGLHFLGPNGGPKLLKANPNAIAANILPKAAASNKTVFYKNGDIKFPKTVKEVIDFLYTKVGAVAESYQALLNQNLTGPQIGRTSENLAMRQDTQNQSKNLVVVNNNTVVLGANRNNNPYSPQSVGYG